MKEGGAARAVSGRCRGGEPAGAAKESARRSVRTGREHGSAGPLSGRTQLGSMSTCSPVRCVRRPQLRRTRVCSGVGFVCRTFRASKWTCSPGRFGRRTERASTLPSSAVRFVGRTQLGSMSACSPVRFPPDARGALWSADPSPRASRRLPARAPPRPRAPPLPSSRVSRAPRRSSPRRQQARPRTSAGNRHTEATPPLVPLHHGLPGALRGAPLPGASRPAPGGPPREWPHRRSPPQRSAPTRRPRRLAGASPGRRGIGPQGGSLGRVPRTERR